MRRIKRLLTTVSATGIGLVLELVLLHYWPMMSSATPAGPETMQEVVRVAEEKGLYFCSDRRDGEIANRLVISDRPLTCQRANFVRFNAPDHPCWIGTVALCYPWRNNMANYDPECSAVWGEMFVYGDPEIIRRLTGR
jgi:hypothetical protein